MHRKMVVMFVAMGVVCAAMLLSTLAVAQQGQEPDQGVSEPNAQEPNAQEPTNGETEGQDPNQQGMAKSQMMRKCGMMMKKAGMSEQEIAAFQAVHQMPIHVDSPSIILGRAEELNLTAEQKEKLRAIESDARQRARDVLDQQQKDKLGKPFGQPTSLMDVCRKMHQGKMGNSMMQQKKDQGMCPCPACPMMQKSQKQDEQQTPQWGQ